jgi:hypothetical protein
VRVLKHTVCSKLDLSEAVFDHEAVQSSESLVLSIFTLQQCNYIVGYSRFFTLQQYEDVTEAAETPGTPRKVLGGWHCRSGDDYPIRLAVPRRGQYGAAPQTSQLSNLKIRPELLPWKLDRVDDNNGSRTRYPLPANSLTQQQWCIDYGLDLTNGVACC